MMRSGGRSSRAARRWFLRLPRRRPRGSFRGPPAVVFSVCPGVARVAASGVPCAIMAVRPRREPVPGPPDIDPAVAKDPEMSAAVEKTVLPDGLTVLSQSLRDRRTLSLGAWLRTVSRDEPREQLGITHFIEHMMFKGTTTRDAGAIAASLESLGGHLDAFTSREQV